MKRMKWAICFAVLACTAAIVLTGCTGSAKKKTESAAEKADSIIPIEEEDELADVEAAPEEGDDVDQGREGRPTDSWNADAPAPSSEETQTETESFALADDADDEAAARAE